MKITIKKFGIYSFVSTFILFQIAFIIGKNLSFGIQEILGYLTIVISLLFVYFGIKHYRDKENQGVLSFKNGMLLGLSITLFVAIGSAIADYIYVTVFHPDFISDYSNYQLEKFTSSLSPEDLELKRQELLENAETLGKPSIMALVMFLTVFLLGTLITLLSSLFLQTNSKQQLSRV